MILTKPKRVELRQWHEKRVHTMRTQIENTAGLCVPVEYGFRKPVLNQTEHKKSISELATLCGLAYKDGKVG